MIYNLRGCGGSGKSYVGFKLLQEYGPGVEVRKPAFRTKSPKLVGHVLPGDLVLVGRYVLGKSTTVEGAGYSGGVDGFYPMTELQELIEGFCADHKFVFFESLLISGTYQRWLDFSVKWAPRVHFGVLTTSPEVCISRIVARNGGKAIDERNLRAFQRATIRCGDKFLAAGANVSWLDPADAYSSVLNAFTSAGWVGR